MDFETAYSKLNKDQKEAVDTLQGPVMVVAGPGTGKTQVLTLRIANILKKTDTPASAILALTFTESAAKSMRERLSKIIGKDAYLVNISTFHSFASSVISENPDVFLINDDHDILSDIERLGVIHKILDTLELEYLCPSGDPYFYSYYISSGISTLKREGVTYNDYKKLVSENKSIINSLQQKEKKTANDLNEIKKLYKQLELRKVYKAYQKEIKEIKRYDFEDLINFVNNEFETNEALLRTYQERFLYILVDEFQDTNNSQYKLLSNLTSYWGEDSDVFVVGDDDQSIYRFQGASVENMMSFLKSFPSAKVINLVNNYRSTQLILDSARSVIQNNKLSIVNELGTITKKLQSNTINEKDPCINIYKFSNGILEASYIAKKIRKLIKKGVDPKDIAVIYRNNNDSNDIETALSKLGVLYNIEGGGNILESEEVKKFLKLLYVVEKSKSKDEDLDLFTLLNYEFLGFDYIENLKLCRFATSKKINFVDSILRINEEKDIKEAEKYKDFLDKITHWQNIDAEFNFLKTFEVILNDSGYLQYLLNQPNSLSSVNKINSLYNEVQKLSKNKRDFKIKDFLKIIDIYISNNLKIFETDFDVEKEAVTLTTCHKAKGQEYKYVFIYKFLDKKWGNNRNVEYIKLPEGIVKLNNNLDLNEDERRLFYVALTRAKHKLYITSSKTYSTDYGKISSEESMFLMEVPETNTKRIDSKKIESKKFIENSAKLFLSASDISTKVESDEQKVLDFFVKDFKLSVTALDTYLQCPYKFKLNNILRTPRSKAPYLAMGTAVHKALEEYYRNYLATNTLQDENFICSKYEEALNKEILTDREHKVLLTKGKRVLKNYLTSYREEFKKPEYLERMFGYGFGKIYVDDVPLVGKVDRIEVLKIENNQKHVKVIDYKTGKIKTLNEIEGNTKDSTGSLKRQLVFYKLLCDLDRTFRYKAVEFELDFVGNGTDGEKCKKYSFQIMQEEVEELKKQVLDTMDKIRKYEFPKIADASICTKCEYIDHCYPQGLPKVIYVQGSLEF